MGVRTKLVNSPYNAYQNARETLEDDAELTRVGPGTPGGEYLRRFWHPIAFTNSLDNVPLRVRIMGEDLVLFRDKSRRIGLLALHCSHRGTSLEFGIIQERGLSCCYHGWHFDVDGRILDTPAEPIESKLKNTLHHGAYPVHEFEGLVFAYMGPIEKKPPFPVFENFNLPGYRTEPWGGNIMPCNWVQIKENCMDPAHTAFLHTIGDGVGFTDSFGVLPELDFIRVPNGMVYVATRRVGENIWVRMTNQITPNIHQFAPTWSDGRTIMTFTRPMQTHWSVPIDDINTINLGFNHYHVDDPDQTLLEEGANFGQACDRPYSERQRVPGDYDAHTSIGPISIHAREYLGHSDRGITIFRKILRNNIRAIKQGKNPEDISDQIVGNIPAYANDTVMHIPSQNDPKTDQKRCREIGEIVAHAAVCRDWSNLPSK